MIWTIPVGYQTPFLGFPLFPNPFPASLSFHPWLVAMATPIQGEESRKLFMRNEGELGAEPLEAAPAWSRPFLNIPIAPDLLLKRGKKSFSCCCY